jgi:hypothetical protein
VQDRYTDDIGQFVKVALMRWLISPSPYGQGHRLGMIWLQEPARRHRADGDHLAYLHFSHDADEDLRSLDPSLYDQLRMMAAQSGRPVSVRETCRVLPTDTVRFDRPLRFDDLVRDDRAARAVSRQRWFHEAMVAVAPCSLVFVDSDNGLDGDDEPLSPDDRADSGIWMSEVHQLLERGQSVVTHHVADPSHPLPELAGAHLHDVHDALGVEPLAMAQKSHGCVRLFTVIPHHRHRSDLQDRIGALQLSRWGDEFRVYRWLSALVTV